MIVDFSQKNNFIKQKVLGHIVSKKFNKKSKPKKTFYTYLNINVQCKKICRLVSNKSFVGGYAVGSKNNNKFFSPKINIFSFLSKQKLKRCRTNVEK